MTGFIGFMNWEITAISANFISLMLILSISMNIHIINNYRINYFSHDKITYTLKYTIINMFWPCFYTALTTIVAFGSLVIFRYKTDNRFWKYNDQYLYVVYFYDIF